MFAMPFHTAPCSSDNNLHTANFSLLLTLIMRQLRKVHKN